MPAGPCPWLHMVAHLEIKRSHFEAMVKQAQAAYPLEICGLMAGADNRVRHIYPIANIRKSPVEYEMDPGEQLQAMLDLENKGWELIAIYHSHPHGPQVPSATDVDMAYYPEAANVIISLLGRQQPRVRAFNIVSGIVTEIPLQIV